MGGQPTKVFYIIDTETWWWMSAEWMSAIVIVFNAIFGLFASGLFYLGYICLKEIIMSFPENYIEYIQGKVTEASLIWPVLLPRGSLNEENAGQYKA